MLETTYKELEELEDSFVGKDIECIPTDGVNNGQSVDLIFDQRVYGVEEAVGRAMKVVRGLSGGKKRKSFGPPLLSKGLASQHFLLQP